MKSIIKQYRDAWKDYAADNAGFYYESDDYESFVVDLAGNIVAEHPELSELASLANIRRPMLVDLIADELTFVV